MSEDKVVDAKAKKSGGFKIPGHWIAIAAFVAIFGVFVGFTFYFNTFSQGFTPATGLSKEEVELIVKDLNPMQQQQIAQNKKQLTEELQNLMAVAREAYREGITEKPEVAYELEYIRKAITATNYDRKTAKQPEEASQMPQQPFSSVTEDDVKAFWDAANAKEGITKESREKEFDQFIDYKITVGKATKQMPEDQKRPSEDELAPVKTNFAKTMITYDRAEEKFASIPKMSGDEKTEWQEAKKSNDLQVKLQQSQFLAAYYSTTVLNEKVEPTEEEIAKYLKDNPEIGDEKAKEKIANDVLKKLDDGGDFAELAKEYSEDPGSKENGGLYEDVPMGQMDPTFEKAALDLEAGKYTAKPVKTKFGYHIIKLEEKTEKKDDEGKTSQVYDVRHILISTQISDPNNPFSQPMSPEDYAKSKLSEEKEKKILDDIKLRNPIAMPADFDVPKPPPNAPGMMRPGAMPGQGPPPPPPAPAPQPAQPNQ